MFKFQRQTTLDLTTYPEPAPSDRSGPPLSQGFMYSLLAMVSAEMLPEQSIEQLAEIHGPSWYHGQLLESLLQQAEEAHPGSSYSLGRSAYFILTKQLQAMGIATAQQMFAALPGIWQNVTRGDSGVFRTVSCTEDSAVVEMEQPYSCSFEEGALVGFLDGLGCTSITSKHLGCMKHGSPFCTAEFHWTK